MDWVIAYDITDPRRLRRVARLMERHAVRCQYSVFLFRGDRAAVERVLDEVAPLLRAAEDVVQAWPVSGDDALARGTPRPVRPAGIVLDGRQAMFVSR